MNKNILIIGFVWPEPTSSAAGSRMMQLINSFLSANYKITFASPSAKSENAFDLGGIGVETVAIEINNSSFDQFIRDVKPSIVLFDRFTMEEQFGWRVADHCPNAMRILDTEDLHGLRKARQQAFKDGNPCDAEYLFNDFSKREIASIYRSDLTLIISGAEMDILNSVYKVNTDLLLYLPFMIDEVSNSWINNLPEFEDRQHFIIIGNFLHEPNYDAVCYLKDTIWPLISRKLPEAELHIYGAYAGERAKRLNDPKNRFFIRGYTEDANAVMQRARVCLAPLRFGAGLKGKLVDAMRNGTPCVMTTMAAEGLFGKMDPNGYIEDQGEDFADKALSLYKSRTNWNSSRTRGFEIIKTRFNRKYLEPDFIKTIEVLKSNLKDHRLQNFTGAMLQYHTLQSTKFMSRWIEEKNKSNTEL
jgi:hypothetical protein